MQGSTEIIAQPVFLLFIGVTVLLMLGYFWGRRRNLALVVSAFDDLRAVMRPADETYTNIGGAIGYHANFAGHKDSPVEQADITLTLLPRQSMLYLPISLLLRRWDRLYLTLTLRRTPPAEGHLIDAGYAAFRGPQITGAERMESEIVQWGGRRYRLYYLKRGTRTHLLRLMETLEQPGGLKHIAFVPHQKRCFIFMVPGRGTVKPSLGPVFDWLETVA